MMMMIILFLNFSLVQDLLSFNWSLILVELADEITDER